jgi:hypothetical protein
MNTLRRLFLASMALSATLAHAAEPVSPSAPLTRSISPILAVLDADHNGTLSPSEIAAAPLALRALDLNADGMISPVEWRASEVDGRPTRVGRGATSFNVVFTLDANHDGELQWLEVANAVLSLKQLDRNGDGELTASELRGGVTRHRA